MALVFSVLAKELADLDISIQIISQLSAGSVFVRDRA